jgi:predicted dehydrogenase
MADLAVAVVGAGVHGSRYAEHLAKGDVPGMRVAAVCRRAAADAAKWRSRGVRFETDAAALFDDRSIDAFIVASPPDLHEEHALRILDRRKPLLLEKPVAPDLDACGRIAAAARKATVPVLVGHSFRYHPVVRAFRDAAFDLAPLRWLSLSQRHERMPQPWQHSRGGGGALLSVGVHMADLARWILGEDPGEPRGTLLQSEPGEAEGTAVSILRSRKGVLVQIEASIVAPARRGFLEASGDAGVVEGDHQLHELFRREGRSRVAIPVGPPIPGLVPLLADFGRGVRGEGTGDAATLEDGIAAVEVVERIREAAGQSPR